MEDIRSHFENEYGQVDYKDLPRPKLAEMLYDLLPLIDEHNRMRQDRLALERCWPTKNCWFHLITTLLGQSVVDLQRIYRIEDPTYIEWDVLKFADFISVDLKEITDRPTCARIMNAEHKLKELQIKMERSTRPFPRSKKSVGSPREMLMSETISCARNTTRSRNIRRHGGAAQNATRLFV